MRSASWGVVMEPSTSERSYGPLTTAREASGKLAISTASATASSSSSQSSRLNWQPSHEENFHTASFGLCFLLCNLHPPALPQSCSNRSRIESNPLPPSHLSSVL